MGKKAVITRYGNFVVNMLFENNREMAIELYEPEKPVIGNIYAGRVRDVAGEIDAAFIDVGIKMPCYFSLRDNRHPIFLNVKTNNKICQGDLIICELERESSKTKGPVVSGVIHIPGRYAVLDTSLSGKCNISKKITGNRKSEQLKALCEPFVCDEYGFIMRTECKNAADDEITDCLRALSEKYRTIMKTAQTARAGDLLYEAEPEAVHDIRTWGLGHDDEVVSDIRSVCELISNTCDTNVRYYEDRFFPLIKLYSMESRLLAATRRTVWLKSGGNIVIEPTEALTVIDVNTGKTVINSPNKEDVIFKTNIEACSEIARQLILRNISGIIIVDFISQKNPEYRKETENKMKMLLSKDYVKASFVDFTKLDLMEITRQKIKRPLYEVLKRKEE